MNRSKVLQTQSVTCKHCGCLLYEGIPQYTSQTVTAKRGSGKAVTFTAPLRRVWWHNATADDVARSSKARGVPTIHTPEP